MDFATVKEGGRIGKCRRCQALFSVLDRNDVARTEDQFSGDDYAMSRQTDQTVQVAGRDDPATRSWLQTDIIAEALPRGVSRVLDIGCFDGLLLRELGERFPEAELHGFDVNPQLEHFFRDDQRLRFWTADLDLVPGSFDLVCMSHSMMYIPDTVTLAAQLSRLVGPGGVVFVQAPDIGKNPFSLLLCDSSYYYTPRVLANVMKQWGFEFKLQGTAWFPREIVGFARHTQSESKSPYQTENQVAASLLTLEQTARFLREIDDDGEMTVLGTTINAAFVDSLLNGRITYFSDENAAKVGTRFRDKEVAHPSAVPSSDLMIIPYGEGAPRIAERFGRLYGGRYRCV